MSETHSLPRNAGERFESGVDFAFQAPRNGGCATTSSASPWSG